MNNVKNNILVFTIDQIKLFDIEKSFLSVNQSNAAETLTKMTTLAKGVADYNEDKAIDIVQTIISQLDKLLEIEGHTIKTSALNNALQDLTFEYHPSQVERRNLKLQKIDWCGVHESMLDLLTNRMDEMKETYSQKQSQYKIREDVTLTVTTLKKYLYFLQSLSIARGEELVKAADIISDSEHILRIYKILT